MLYEVLKWFCSGVMLLAGIALFIMVAVEAVKWCFTDYTPRKQSTNVRIDININHPDGSSQQSTTSK
jgi:hypothetical protein